MKASAADEIVRAALLIESPPLLRTHRRRLVSEVNSEAEGARADWMRAIELQAGMRKPEENLKRQVAALRLGR